MLVRSCAETQSQPTRLQPEWPRDRKHWKHPEVGAGGVMAEAERRGWGEHQVLPAEHSMMLARFLAERTTGIQKQNWRRIPADAE